MKFWNSLFEWILGARSEGRGGAATLVTDPAGAGESGASVGLFAVDRWWTPADDALLDVQPLERSAPLSAEAEGLDRILGGHHDRDDLRLPALPKAAQRVLQLLASDSRDAGRIAEEAANDQVVALAILRQANSAFYRGRERVSDLRLAVSRLGETVLRSLMLQYSLQVATQMGRGDRRLGAIVWNGSLASARIMRAMTELVRDEGEATYPAGAARIGAEDAYLLGLLHDVGNVLVLREAQEQQAALRYQIDALEFDWLCRKHHQQAGMLIADAWNLPDRLKAVVADHHKPIRADTPTELCMLALCDMLKSMLGYAPRQPYNLPHSAAACALGLADRAAFADLLDALPEELAELPAAF